jgi:hypothetical protein
MHPNPGPLVPVRRPTCRYHTVVSKNPPVSGAAQYEPSAIPSSPPFGWNVAEKPLCADDKATVRVTGAWPPSR